MWSIRPFRFPEMMCGERSFSICCCWCVKCEWVDEIWFYRYVLASLLEVCFESSELRGSSREHHVFYLAWSIFFRLSV
jgi:hypothetical protein